MTSRALTEIPLALRLEVEIRSLILADPFLCEDARTEKARRGWRLSDHASVSRVSQWLSPSDDHEYPASEIVTAIKVTGRDYVSPILLREAMRTEIEREKTHAARAPMASVRRDTNTTQRRRA